MSIWYRSLFHILGMGLSGLVTARLLQFLAGPDGGPWVPPGSDLLWYSWFGGMFGGAVTVWAFGRPQWSGAVWAATGAILATAIGSFIGGLAFGHSFGGILGLGTVAESIIFQPLVGVSWGLSMVVLHGVSLRLRKQSFSH